MCFLHIKDDYSSENQLVATKITEGLFLTFVYALLVFGLLSFCFSVCDVGYYGDQCQKCDDGYTTVSTESTLASECSSELIHKRECEREREK